MTSIDVSETYDQIAIWPVKAVLRPHRRHRLDLAKLYLIPI
jgi:hypothetical protein